MPYAQPHSAQIRVASLKAGEYLSLEAALGEPVAYLDLHRQERR